METVIIVHRRERVCRGLRTRLTQPVYAGPALDDAWPPASVAVVDSAITDWIDVVASLRQKNPAMRLIVLVKKPTDAERAVNQLRADRITFDETHIEQLAEDLRRAPLTKAQALEREVQSRTSVLQQVKSQWEQTFDAVQDPLAVIDDDYRLIRVNRAYARHMGCNIVDAPRQRCFDLRAPSPHAYAVDGTGICAACPVAPARQRRMPTKSTIEDTKGLRWEVSAYPVDIPGVPDSFVVHYRDVTQQMEALAKLAHADKMSAVGKLAGAIAHELNSPMTSIMVFSEALANKLSNDSDLRAHAIEICGAAQRCRKLLQGLLRFARRPRSREPGHVSLAAVLSEVRPLVQHRIDVSQIRLEVALPDDLAHVHAHVTDIEHLLVDILTNAMEACSAGDTITISADDQPDHGMVELRVRDTGRGMSPEVLRAAFDPFFTTKPKGQAAGLGLTTCEAIVADMGGNVGLHSTPGEGALVWIRLPVAAAEAHDAGDDDAR